MCVNARVRGRDSVNVDLDMCESVCERKRKSECECVWKRERVCMCVRGRE